MSDDYSFGVLSSVAYGSWVQARRADPKSGERRPGGAAWSSFPWPQAPDAHDVEAIAELANSILMLPAAFLRQGVTLAEPYGIGDQPQSHELANLTSEVDRAVLRAYGSNDPLGIVDRLEALNEEIAANPEQARGRGCELAEARRSDYRLRPAESPPPVPP